jgi:S-layer homology domain
MKHNLLTRVSFTILVILFTLSVSGWTGNPINALAAPYDGAWTGTTSRGHPVSFSVSSSGTQWSNFSLTTDFNFGSCSGTFTQTLITPGPITNNQFNRTSGDLAITGQFTSQGIASGTYSYTNHLIPFCGSLTQSGTWTAQVPAPPAPTFSDVAFSYWAHDWIERLYSANITGGCGTNPLAYCPEGTVTRAQMAIFLLRGIHNATYNPPAVGGSTGFTDVDPTYWAGAWIKQLAAEGITGGCGSGSYCPEGAVTRAQMAVFLLRSKYGSSYSPPAVGGSTGFTDVAPTYWAGAWIKQLVAEGVTSGCGTGTYCPESPVTRAQMAVFLVKTFNLP